MTQTQPTQGTTAIARADDGDLVRRALARDSSAFRTIMQTYNRRLYRLARSILRDDAEAEDAVQESYVRAFTHLQNFRGESSLGTWLSRIAINEALGRLRTRRVTVDITTVETQGNGRRDHSVSSHLEIRRSGTHNAQRQLLQLVEKATDNLPEVYRTVFITRVIEGMRFEETAEILNLRPETVKTRLHRARRLVHEQLNKQIGPVLMDAFPFAGRRCERMTAAVMKRLGLPD